MNLELTHIVQALQISISVQRWKREDEADREEEVEGMMEMLLRMEQDRRIDQAEIINALDVRHFSRAYSNRKLEGIWS